jgi:ABC transporter related
LAGSPGKIVTEIKIDLKKSENKGYNNEEIIMSEEFIGYKREILKYL